MNITTELIRSYKELLDAMTISELLDELTEKAIKENSLDFPTYEERRSAGQLETTFIREEINTRLTDA